jgi:hypothetical protein
MRVGYVDDFRTVLGALIYDLRASGQEDDLARLRRLHALCGANGEGTFGDDERLVNGDLYHEASDVGNKPAERAPVLVLLFSICHPCR